ncbi:MAG: hypothetical protein H0T46_24295 [Deltaproteobacteria bacterium]|nr:hypothetical protein [Deltaproteobacteria bacterium]
MRGSSVLFLLAVGCGSDEAPPDAPSPDAAPQTVELRNDTGVCSAHGEPAPNQGDWWWAVRLTPPSYPFTIQRVTYRLAGHDMLPNPFSHVCDSAMAHDARVFKASGATPPSDPVVLETFDVPTGVTPFLDRLVDHTLATPIRLGADEHVFIAVRIANLPTAQPYRTMCVHVCSSATTVPMRDYVSQGTTPPFTWRAPSGAVNFDFRAYGVAQ